jgi:hypothetical protein
MKTQKLKMDSFNALVEHRDTQKAQFAKKKSTILSGSKYASRTLRNDVMGSGLGSGAGSGVGSGVGSGL